MGNSKKTVAVVGTFDSKYEEYSYIKAAIEKAGCETFMIDTGVFTSKLDADVSSNEIAAAAGYDLAKIAEKRDRATAMEALSSGLESKLKQLYEDGRFDGVISLGGTGGTALAAPAMRGLPLGVPKIIVSTVASGDTAKYIGTSDIVMMPSIVDVAGLNSISRVVFDNAVFAVTGMVKGDALGTEKTDNERPLITATMFGVTTPCVTAAKKYLEEQGYEVLVFHANGTGGRTMESIISTGKVAGVLDITTTEWADELFGGIFAAGPERNEAAAKHHVPQVVSTGAMDMIDFGPYDDVPEQYKTRNLYKHNPEITLMRTTEEENRMCGHALAEKLNMADAPTAIMLPLKGVSMVDAEGQPFYGPEEDKALFDTFKKELKGNIEVIELNKHINDKEFAIAAAKKLLELIR